MTVTLETTLERATYDAKDCAIGAVHIGLGAFHRAHQAVYFDAYLGATEDLRWGIAAVNLRGSESEVFAASARAKDGYVLKTISPEGEVAHRVIRPHVAFADWAGDAKEAEDLLALPSVHLVTITVTESGYYLDDTGGLDKTHPALKAEFEGGALSTVYAYLTQALRARIAAGGGALTIMCCDNIRGNGRMLERNLKTYLEEISATEVLDWVKAHASFPNSMVDRITPKPKPEDSTESAQLFGREADQTVAAEDFIQWVVEDAFAGPRPALEQVGVTVTVDVDPYEEAKIRILNGGHTAVTYLAALSGHETFDMAMRDPQLAEHFWNYESHEVLPALDEIELPFDKASYTAEIARRFSNANIGDTIERICGDGFGKFPVFVRPTLEACFAAGIEPVHGIRAVAGWYVYARRMAKGQLPGTYYEPNRAALAPLIADGALSAFAGSEQLWAGIPAQYPQFESLLSQAINEVEATWPV